MAEKKAVMFLAKGAEEIESITILDVLRRAGIGVAAMALDDAESLAVECAHGAIVEADTAWSDELVASADALVAPGGMGGMMALCENAKVLGAFAAAAKSGKLVAAVCAAPIVLAKAGVLCGKRATCYPGMEKHLDGAVHAAGDVVTDGNVITSRGPATSMEFALAIAARLAGQEAADAVARGLLAK